MNSFDLTDAEGKEPISHDEIRLLHRLALMVRTPEPVIVNIGAADGVSTCAFLEVRPNALIYSVDVNECHQEFENVRRCGLDASRIKRLLGRSEEIGKDWADGPCDLLFVDGGHFNAGNDLDVWRDKVKPGGIIACHDYQEVCPPNNPGSVYADVNARMDMARKIGRVERLIAFWA
jgi:predicted O-methyltransferase YrrM